ncbi:hypothetical protein [Burkholderia cenocepacia]|uniref:hypothetical protein n=1 Tax=Burkholderia cenocepacia TaxID=95486 RepID=UPI002938D55D|nr:hypothetical protein [Burkholderia cenocepacia]MDV3102912.1 hypothetical protein [Burkholderia cenocepacia]
MSTPGFYLIRKIAPESWGATRMFATGPVSFRSTYPTPAHVLATLPPAEAPVELEIHVQADDMTAPAAVRAALLKLRDAGIDVARRPYERTFEQFSQIGLTEDDLNALIYEKPFFGTPAARLEVVDSQRKVVLELAIVVVGDLP